MVLDQNKNKLLKVKISYQNWKRLLNHVLLGLILGKELIYSNESRNFQQYGRSQMESKFEMRRSFKSRRLVLNSREKLYYEDGLKEGLWTEPIKDYWSKVQVDVSGEYFHNEKCKRWNYFYNHINIGGGQYNKQAQKNGKWNELQDNFSDSSQVIYNGEYKNGKDVGSMKIINKT